VELQGQLFFGTADQLLSEIEPLLANAKYILLDMRRVQSIDYTGSQSAQTDFRKNKRTKWFFDLYFCSFKSAIRTKYKKIHRTPWVNRNRKSEVF